MQELLATPPLENVNSSSFPKATLRHQDASRRRTLLMKFETSQTICKYPDVVERVPTIFITFNN